MSTITVRVNPYRWKDPGARRYTINQWLPNDDNDLYPVLSWGEYTGGYATVFAIDGLGPECEITGGLFFGGEFNGGEFWGGEFYGGVYNGGLFNIGKFFGGNFHGGRFFGGTVYGGEYYDGDFNDTNTTFILNRQQSKPTTRTENTYKSHGRSWYERA